jgi:hypothetical protein
VEHIFYFVKVEIPDHYINDQERENAPGRVDEQKRLLAQTFFYGGEGGIRISSPQWGRVDEQKRLLTQTFFLWRGGRDSNPRPRFKPRHSLSRRAQSATLAPPQGFTIFDCRLSIFWSGGPIKNRQSEIVNRGGGSGIRTHGSLRYDGFQDRYLQPLGHPSEPKDFTISSSRCEAIAHIRDKVGIIHALWKRSTISGPKAAK